MAPIFNPPPGWPRPPKGWQPPPGWQPDPSWPPLPDGWQLWLPDDDVAGSDPTSVEPMAATAISAPPTPAIATPPPQSTSPEPSPSPAPSTPAQFDSRPAAEFEDPDLVDLNDDRVLQRVGIYRYHHPLENAAAYKERLQSIDERIANAVRVGQAIEVSNMFTFDNSLAKGRRMTSDLSKLMLRAYNAEAENCVRSMRAGNILTAKRRLEAAVKAIERLGSMMEMRISPAYHQLRVEELELTADYQMKVQEEREAAREERERLREERKAEQELAAERERLDKERNHLLNALASMERAGDTAAAAELAAKVEALDDAIRMNDFRVANIRAGYVYVISNRGAFGPKVVKIGLTRRLEPLDRIRELGDASVPFPFDVHALFFAEDAVTLENDLHKEFAARRLNQVNLRREFFFATPEEVRDVLLKKVGNLLEFTEHAESAQYLQSRSLWPAGLAES